MQIQNINKCTLVRESVHLDCSMSKGEFSMSVFSGLDITQILVSVLGAGGLSGTLVAIFSRRKYKLEALKLEQDLRDSREEANRKSIDYIQQKMTDIAKKYEEECDALRKRNEELDSKISDLSNRLQTLMEWVVVDNNKYRSWLENELRKLNPDISFPYCAQAPIKTSDPHSEETEHE